MLNFTSLIYSNYLHRVAADNRDYKIANNFANVPDNRPH
jgi:hypothetical protein